MSESKFDANTAARSLRGYMKGLGTNESGISTTIGGLTSAQMQEVRQALHAQFKRDLVKGINKYTSINSKNI